MSSLSAFSQTKREPWAAASPCLHCFDGGAQSVGRGAAVTCCAQTNVPLPHKNNISVKLCQIPRYSALKSRFRFNHPIPRFRPRFHDHGNHRALHYQTRMVTEGLEGVICHMNDVLFGVPHRRSMMPMCMQYYRRHRQQASH